MDEDDIKDTIRGILTSTSRSITVEQLLRDYQSLEHRPMPLPSRYASYMNYLCSLTDTIRIVGNQGMKSHVQLVQSINSAHIAKLVDEQRPSSKGKRPRGPRREIYYHAPAASPRGLPSKSEPIDHLTKNLQQVAMVEDQVQTNGHEQTIMPASAPKQFVNGNSLPNKVPQQLPNRSREGKTFSSKLLSNNLPIFETSECLPISSLSPVPYTNTTESQTLGKTYMQDIEPYPMFENVMPLLDKEIDPCLKATKWLQLTSDHPEAVPDQVHQDPSFYYPNNRAVPKKVKKCQPYASDLENRKLVPSEVYNNVNLKPCIDILTDDCPPYCHGLSPVPIAIQEKFHNIIKEHPTGLVLADFFRIYSEKHGKNDDIKGYSFGFTSNLEMFMGLPKIFRILRLTLKTYKLIDATKDETEEELYFRVLEKNLNCAPQHLKERFSFLIRASFLRGEEFGLPLISLEENYKKMFLQPLCVKNLRFKSVEELTLCADKKWFDIVEMKGQFYLKPCNENALKPTVFARHDPILGSFFPDWAVGPMFNYTYENLSLDLAPGTQIVVNTGEVYHPHKFYMGLHKNLPKIEHIFDSMRAVYEDASSEHATKHMKRNWAVPGVCCAVYFNQEGWCRARIQRASPRRYQVYVNCVDLGTVLAVRGDELRFLDRDLARLPVSLVHAQLAGIAPASPNGQWHHKAADYITTPGSFRAYIHTFEVVNGKESVATVSLFDEEKGANVAHLLIENGYAKPAGKIFDMKSNTLVTPKDNAAVSLDTESEEIDNKETKANNRETNGNFDALVELKPESTAKELPQGSQTNDESSANNQSSSYETLTSNDIQESDQKGNFKSSDDSLHSKTKDKLNIQKPLTVNIETEPEATSTLPAAVSPTLPPTSLSSSAPNHRVNNQQKTDICTDCNTPHTSHAAPTPDTPSTSRPMPRRPPGFIPNPWRNWNRPMTFDQANSLDSWMQAAYTSEALARNYFVPNSYNSYYPQQLMSYFGANGSPNYNFAQLYSRPTPSVQPTPPPIVPSTQYSATFQPSTPRYNVWPLPSQYINPTAPQRTFTESIPTTPNTISETARTSDNKATSSTSAAHAVPSSTSLETQVWRVTLVDQGVHLIRFQDKLYFSQEELDLVLCGNAPSTIESPVEPYCPPRNDYPQLYEITSIFSIRGVVRDGTMQIIKLNLIPLHAVNLYLESKSIYIDPLPYELITLSEKYGIKSVF